jgi:hypothetical protein
MNMHFRNPSDASEAANLTRRKHECKTKISSDKKNPINYIQEIVSSLLKILSNFLRYHKFSNSVYTTTSAMYPRCNMES